MNEYFSENNLQNIESSADIDGWVQDLTDKQADWIATNAIQ